MKRLHLSIQTIASYQNLMLAANKAARGKRDRKDVIDFFDDLDRSISTLSEQVLTEKSPRGQYRHFTILDPKKRLIHAACFEDRVLHHALMNVMAPRIERAMIDHSYACRENKGVLKAGQQVQRNMQRYQWYVKIDIDGYFAAIDHEILNKILSDTFKGAQALALLSRIINSYSVTTGKGLPIGSLTSQHFANLYLDVIDRAIQENTSVRGYVRYMDDMIWWCDSKQQAKETLLQLQRALWVQRSLTVKPTIQINRSRRGVTYCGFRIMQNKMLLTRRKKKRYQSRRVYWEKQFVEQQIDALRLQAVVSSVQATTAHTRSKSWRQENLIRFPVLEA